MIRVSTGEFKLDNYKSVIYPDLSLSEFKSGDIPILNESGPNKSGWASCWFKGALNALKAEFTIQFRFGKVQGLIFEPADEAGLSGDQLKHRLDRWLLEAIGYPPPYQYPWGCITCPDIDANSGVPSVGVMFKAQILSMGFKTVESFYEFRRGRERTTN